DSRVVFLRAKFFVETRPSIVHVLCEHLRGSTNQQAIPNRRTSAEEKWRTIELPARALGIAENNGNLWVCGADELIATSEDGGNTWTAKHSAKNGSLLLTVGFADEQFGYAAGTGGQIFITRDGGTPQSVVLLLVVEALSTGFFSGLALMEGLRSHRSWNWTWLLVLAFASGVGVLETTLVALHNCAAKPRAKIGR